MSSFCFNMSSSFIIITRVNAQHNWTNLNTPYLHFCKQRSQDKFPVVRSTNGVWFCLPCKRPESREIYTRMNFNIRG